jgi:hypothetical protein
MPRLTNEQAKVLDAFISSFELYVTGAWPAIEKGMRDDFGIDNPEEALEEAKQALQQ